MSDLVERCSEKMGISVLAVMERAAKGSNHDPNMVYSDWFSGRELPDWVNVYCEKILNEEHSPREQALLFHDEDD